MDSIIKSEGYVYHIQNPNNPSIEEGYIGVVNAKKGIYRRFREHSTDYDHMRKRIRENNVTFENHVKIVFQGSLKECYMKEHELRSSQKIGWNVASGGAGWNYKSDISDLSKYRSDIQKQRMEDEDLKRRQSESFKKNYYANEEVQKLRSDRAKEHMSNPEKRDKCLNAMHKKIKCPHCEYENNAGNVKLHIKRKHSND
jgi:hypothetical protein